MFDVLVYLYETYYRPDACPDSEALVKKLSAIGFEEEEIAKALGWLTALAETTNELSDSYPHQTACLLYTSPSPRDQRGSRMPSSA